MEAARFGDLHLVKNYFSTAVREIAMAVNRSAHSYMLADTSMQYGYGDTDNAILTATGDLISTSERTITHMASLPTALRLILRHLDLADVYPGDVWTTNDPYSGAVHPNDVCMLRPVFWDGAPQYWVGALAHITDIGGASPGGIAVGASSVFAEGLIIPPTKIFDRGVINETLMSFIRSNCRTPVETSGDVLALVAGTNVGARRISDLLARRGGESVRDAVKELFDYTERLTRNGISELADGTYRGESWSDDDGIQVDRPYCVRASVEVRGDHLTVDLSETDEQVRGSTNSSYSQTVNAVTYATKVFAAPRAPLNEGFWRCLTINAPEGSVVNPRRPAACNNRMANTVPAIVEAIMLALSPVAPERVGKVAGCGVPEVHVATPSSGEAWVHLDCLWGGFGARDRKDGVDGGGNAFVGGGGGIMPIEPAELAYALRCEGFTRRQDSGGPGLFRGGLGVEERWTFLRDCYLSCRTDRWKRPPPGLAGGGDGVAGAYVLNPDTPEEEFLPSKFSDRYIPAGSVVAYLTCGGGGYGGPLERPVPAVVADLESGAVSIAAAFSDYGVVASRREGDGAYVADESATAVERHARAGAR